MNFRNVFAVAVLAGTCMASNGQVLISEVVDGPLAGGNPKFLELFNSSTTQSVTLGAGWRLRIYSNGGTAANTSAQYDFGGNSGANEITLAPGATFTIANTANGGGTGWTPLYGAGNQPTVFSSTFPNGNGDDAYTLENNGVITDVFGVIGNAPACNGGTWNYQDSYARRAPNVCAPNAVFTASEWIIPGSDALEAGNVGTCGNAPPASNIPLWTTNVQNMTSPNFHANVCAGGNDCNNNGFSDASDISSGRSRDCNGNQLPDECDISSGASADCNGNAIPDSCEIAANPALDCNGNSALDSCEIALDPANLDCNNNSRLDSCDIAAGTEQDLNNNGRVDSCEPFLFDCNGNSTEDATDISNGTSQDCNANSIPDECELANGRLTDVDGNGTPDACEGAYAAEATINATVQPDPFGVRNAPNGAAFMNVQGVDSGTFASYGGLRFDLAPITAQFDAAYGAGAWTIDRAYLYLQQSNAAFTAPGDVEIVWTDNDAIDFSNNAAPETTFYGNYATDYTDLAQLAPYTFTQGTINTNGSGTIEAYQIAGSDLSTPGAPLLAAELASGSGQATILLHEASSAVAATYAGITNFTWSGPQLVVFATAGGGCGCAADYNVDGGVDGGDVETFFIDWAAAAGCSDVNVDGGVDGGDVEAFFAVWSAGGC
jgi:hypothetical protein